MKRVGKRENMDYGKTKGNDRREREEGRGMEKKKGGKLTH